MNSLRDLDRDVAMNVPEADGLALKALARGEAHPEQQQRAYRFIVHELAGITKLPFSMPGSEGEMAWHNGRRFVGLQIERIVADPMDIVAELPRARSITEQVRRRGGGDGS